MWGKNVKNITILPMNAKISNRLQYPFEGILQNYSMSQTTFA